MHVICCDLEGVFVPEIWINVAEKTGIEELRLTTTGYLRLRCADAQSACRSWMPTG